MIEVVNLFDVKDLLDTQQARGAKTGIASSVRSVQSAVAGIYPCATNQTLPMSPAQAEPLKSFASTLITFTYSMLIGMRLHPSGSETR